MFQIQTSIEIIMFVLRQKENNMEMPNEDGLSYYQAQKQPNIGKDVQTH